MNNLAMNTLGTARSFAFATLLGVSGTVGALTVDFVFPAQASAQIDDSYFYENLAPYGNWVESSEFGWVWYPHNRASGWRPYTVGRWEWADTGEWLWVSDEPFGWATYHYGRWYLDPFNGWVWIPGSVWAPAWVSWRAYDDYIGWCPLSPWSYWDDSWYWRASLYDGWYGGRRDWDRHRDWDRRGDRDRDGRDRGDWGWNGDRDRNIDRAGRDGDRHGGGFGRADDSWTFTRKRDFAGTRVDKVALDRTRAGEVFRNSRELQGPSDEEARHGRGITRAVDRQSIERAAGRSIRPVRVEDAKAPPAAGRNHAKSDRVQMFRPQVASRADAPTPDRLGIAKPRGGEAGRGGNEANRRMPAQPGRGGSAVQTEHGRGGSAGGRAFDSQTERGRQLDRSDGLTIDRGRGGNAGQRSYGTQTERNRQGVTAVPGERGRGPGTIDRGYGSQGGQGGLRVITPQRRSGSSGGQYYGTQMPTRTMQPPGHEPMQAPRGNMEHGTRSYAPRYQETRQAPAPAYRSNGAPARSAPSGGGRQSFGSPGAYHGPSTGGGASRGGADRGGSSHGGMRGSAGFSNGSSGASQSSGSYGGSAGYGAHSSGYQGSAGGMRGGHGR